jgi:hypothetical protein
MVSLFDISRWYHCIRCILYTNKVITGNAMHIPPGSVGFACSPFLSVSLEEMGCEPVLNLATTPDEAVSIICTFVDKTIPSTCQQDFPLFMRAFHGGHFIVVSQAKWPSQAVWAEAKKERKNLNKFG